MPRAEARRQQNPSCGDSPALAPGIFGRRQTQNARAGIALLLRGRGTGQAEDKAQLLLCGARWPPQEQVWRCSQLPAPPREGGLESTHRAATEMCFHNHLIFCCQMWPEYVILSTLQSRDPWLNQRHSRLSTKKVNIFQRAQRSC